jgi:hypothetical protein
MFVRMARIDQCRWRSDGVSGEQFRCSTNDLQPSHLNDQGLISSLPRTKQFLGTSLVQAPHKRRPVIQSPAIRKEFSQEASVPERGQLAHALSDCHGQFRQLKAFSPAGTTAIRH